jgi:O-antigen/teichoic acid export membrane protein
MAGQVVNMLLQAAYFVLLARLLGVVAYGLFAASYALVNVVTPYSALGSSMLFMRYVSLDPSTARVFWGNTLLTILIVSLIIGGVLLVIAPHVIGAAPLGLIIALIVANCVMSQVAMCASSVFLTLHQVKSAAINRLLSNFMRTLILVAMLVFMHTATARQWGYGILFSTSLAALISLGWVRSAIGPMVFSVRHLFEHLSEGFGFSFAGSTESVYNDLDKILLSHYNMNAAAGIYTMAYRIADFATAPVSSLVSAVMPRWFALSKEGFLAVAGAYPKLLKVSLAAGFGAAVSIFLGSPLIVKIVGHGFAESLIAMRWLCWLPVLRAVHQVVGSVLTASGRQPERTAAQFAIGVINAGLNLWLIPIHGWRGAAWASLASDGLLGLLNLLLVLYHQRWSSGMRPVPGPEMLLEADQEGALD